MQPTPTSSRKNIQTDEKDEGEDEPLEKPPTIKPLEKVVIHEIMTGIPRSVAEHELKTYPHIKPRVQRKRSIAPDRRKVVKDEVTEWIKLNKACPKDLYPLPEIEWKIESLIGFKYKCFLDAYKGYHQIQMAKKDEEKTAFHTNEGIFCYTKMPFRLKNIGATYQRLVDTIFEGKMGRNLEAYVDDMVVKSKTELKMIKDVEETLMTLKKVSMKLNPKKCSFRMKEGKFLGYILTFEGIRANPEKTKAVMNMPSPSNLKQMQRLSGKLAALNRFLSKATERALPCLDRLKKCTNKKDFHWTIEAEEAFQAIKKLILELPTLTAPKKEEELMVYLSAANEAVSAVLLVERDGRQIPIHYLSRTLQGAEINYPPMEKLALALVHTARRLRRYFLGHIVKEKTNGSDDTLAEGESREEQEATVTKAPENLKVEADVWKLYTDGASNEHGSGTGLILIDPEGVEYSYTLRLNFANSNNDAEYKALLASLRIETKMKVEKMHAFVDSKLVANQVEGSYEAKVVQCEGLTKGVLIEELNERSMDMAEVNAIIEEATRIWMTPIQEYIEHGILPEDAVEA
ncbi:reverse transcriptase domain-containing protein [Tanacetum coccineum]